MTLHSTISRRHMLASSTAAAAGCCLTSSGLSSAEKSTVEPATPNPFNVRYCLNTSTIRGQELPLEQIVDIAAKSGYDAIEPWIREIDLFASKGGSLADVKKKIADAGLKVESAIGFAKWIVDDDAERAAGIEQLKKDMDALHQIGGTRIAAPPTGATEQSDLNLSAAAERYRAILEIGASIGVVPQVELWGFSKSMSRLGEIMFVATESGHREACVLTDIYHIYKGGSDFAGIKMINGKSMHVMHMNDYPSIEREKISDADRVYPGDGVAPVTQILTDMRDAGFEGILSLELFNRELWKQDPAQVAKTGLEKMKAAVAKVM